MTREDLEHMTDNQLMELVRKENLKAAYDVLVLRYYQDAVRFCMKMRGDDSSSPETVYVKNEEYEELLKWIEELPKDYRRVLLLFCVEVMSYQEIAISMEENVAQARVLLHKAGPIVIKV
ncbi:MAG: sigma-70 family RNA polymerase sigma factor [Faecalicatena sp.]|uniref:RNA polymerase sigma factor n=1 Tax=Faecalicatena sp. TaxID=2005360 RepID=UPI002583B99C|nr:sigma-70 family RNA polymerase sigma factor [Faecalicatena sp.]MCI6468286.1 sigma-70 family RNA polymerase sigma factor [Faecalicatena sp.]MDY5620540.1 sigma-70 family RNA polymerase sigma factor [Lachnospiraceae bacterium]